MKRLVIFLIATVLTASVFANINFINISKISQDEKLVGAFKFINDNQNYFDHWSNEWTYDMPKDEVIAQLRKHYATFSAITTKNDELWLLLGDISHYLYNLDDTAFFRTAISNYKTAITMNPQDYRAYWFLAYHYAQSNVPKSAFEYFIQAQAKLPAEQPAEFWDDYAFSTAIAGMPSHAIFAMDRASKILGRPGNVESQLGQNIRNRLVNVDNDSIYRKGTIWSAIQGNGINFICRPLGIRFLIDSTWNLSLSDYINHQCFITLEPHTIKNNKGKDIHYTLALLMKTVNADERLSDFLNQFISKYPNKSEISFSTKFDKINAFEIRDQSMYKDVGGGHLYMIGVEREMPEYPGLLLENPISLPNGEKDKLTYYTISDSKNRFKGRIFYLIILDTCEDIHEQSLVVFRNFFENQLNIE